MRGSSWMRSLMVVGALLLGATGCGESGNGTYVRLLISGTVGSATPIRSIGLALTLNGGTATTTFEANPIELPTDALLEIGSGEGRLDVVATARAADGSVLATAAGGGVVVKGKTVDVSIVFGSTVPDAGIDSPTVIDGPAAGDLAVERPVGETAGHDGSGPDRAIDSSVLDANVADVPGTGGVTTDVPSLGGAGGADGGGGMDGGGALDGGGSYALTVVPTSLDFGVILPGGVSTPQLITVTNTGTGPTPRLTLVAPDAKVFALANDACSGAILQAGAGCKVGFVFSPVAAGVVQANASIGPLGGPLVKLKLIGAGGGVKPELLVTPAAADFRVVDVGQSATLDFTVRNIGTAEAGTLDVKLVAPAVYKIVTDRCTGTVLTGQGQCLFTVAFTPAASGLTGATVDVTSTLGLVASAAASGTGRDFVTASVLFAGTGAGTVSAPGLSCASGTSCVVSVARLDPLGTLTLTAAPDSTSVFGGWSGGGCSGTGTCTVSLASAPTVTATFTIAQYPLNVVKSGTGAGTITSNPAGVSCGTTCVASYDHGQAVTLSAAPAASSTFTGWSGAGCSGTGTCTVTVTAATLVTAAFSLNKYGLKVIKSGTGDGTVVSDPSGIKCGTSCSADFPYGTGVVLTAEPQLGSTFAGWSLRACGNDAVCKVTVDGATSITATFKPVLTCGIVSTAASCTNGSMTSVILLTTTPQECQIQCRDALLAAGQTSGCWIMAGGLNDTCYCRNGALSIGGTSYGGACNP